MKQYKIFISHSWKYDDNYQKVREWIDDNLYWVNMSVPKDKPKDANSKLALKRAIENNIVKSSGVIVVSGMYAQYSEWIDTEIEIALKYGKPIIGIVPRGRERIPSVVSNNAEMIRWNSYSLIEAIKRKF